MTTIERAEEIARDMLGRAKEYFAAKGELPPYVFFVRDGEIGHRVCIHSIQGTQQIRFTYNQVKAVARAVQPDASIAINAGYLKTTKDPTEWDKMKKEGADYLSADLEASECLFAEIKGPAMKSMCLVIVCKRNEVGDIEFDEIQQVPDEVSCVQSDNGLVPDWWKPDAAQCAFCQSPNVSDKVDGPHGPFDACVDCAALVKKRDMHSLVERAADAISPTFPLLKRDQLTMYLSRAFGTVFSYQDHSRAMRRAMNN